MFTGGGGSTNATFGFDFPVFTPVAIEALCYRDESAYSRNLKHPLGTIMIGGAFPRVV